MTNDNFDDLLGISRTRGGKRENAGRKKKVIDESGADPHVEYTKSRARKESADANLKELEFNIKSGEYLPREDIRQASATAFATITQTLRSIPDNLERRLGISPAVAQEVGNMIDEAMGNLASDLEKIHGENS